MSIKYHFFGKDCLIDRALSNRSNLESALKEKNIFSETVLFVNQVHGNQVVTVDDQTKIHGNQDLPKADAIVTNLKNVVIGVITADCSPILFFDKEKNIKYVYHTGGAVGATTCLLIVPNDSNKHDVNGLVVSILCNSQDTREIVKFALNISEIFLKE